MSSADVGQGPGLAATCWRGTTRRSPPGRAAYVADLQPDDLDRVVDEAWDPPVTLGARLVSVVNEVNAHLGQAQYVRGLLDARA